MNKVYLISGGYVKIANKKFTSVKNDYCINFTKNTNVQEAVSEGGIATQHFEFIKIAEIEEQMTNKSIDVIGSVVHSGPKDEIKLKSGEMKSKKLITLADDSNCSINLTLWGDENCDKYASLQTGQILAIKCARISDFGGKSLNASASSQIFVDLKHPDFEQIKAWQRGGSQTEIKSLTVNLRANDGYEKSENKPSNLSVSLDLQLLICFVIVAL